MSIHYQYAKTFLASIAPDVHGLISKQTVVPDGVPVTRVRFVVGAKWSNDLNICAGTASCELPHVALVLSGTLTVVTDDGSEDDCPKNEVMLLPPGHDAWTVADEHCVLVEVSYGNDFYSDHTH